MVIRDAVTMLAAQPKRVISQGVGIALGAALFVIALGLGETISAQVDDTFDTIKATTVTVDATQDTKVAELDQFVTRERLDAAAAVAGVVSISRLGINRDQTLPARAVATLPPFATATANVVVADANLLNTVEATIDGFGLTPLDDTTRRDVAVIGRGLAATLGIEQPGALIEYGATQLAVIGIITETERMPDLLNSVIISELTARHAIATADLTPRVIVRTAPGAGEIVAAKLALHLRPDAPELLAVAAPISPEDLHRVVSNDIRLLSVGAALVVLVAGIFAAANLMLFAVTQRMREIGMRRALGASSAQILSMIVLEAVFTGLFAGTVGTVTGLWVLLAVCIANRWAPTIGLDVIWIGMLAGTVGGMFGGAVPGVMAARIQPAEAVRA